MRSFAITGVTVSGNMGGAAMLAAAMDQLSRRSPGAQFKLLSIYPARDGETPCENLDVVDARPARLILLYLPMAVLAWPFAGMPIIRRWLSRLPYFRALIEADAVIDLCGTAFVDRRGLPLLAYNVACCLPAIVMGTPVVKLAQALGPFRTFGNRLAGRFVLNRCALVVARGDTTLRHLREVCIANVVSLPDVSFTLNVNPDDRVRAALLLPSTAASRPLLVVSPSEVVRRLKSGHGAGLADTFVALLRKCILDGWRVAIVPHSFGGRASKNNDLMICKTIVADLKSPHAVLVHAEEDPRLLRAILGRGDLFIGCRFHSVVGALAMGVPTLTIGWSHKYQEMVGPLQPGDWTIDWRDFTADAAFARFQALAASRASIAAEIRGRLEGVRRDAGQNFDMTMEVLAS